MTTTPPPTRAEGTGSRVGERTRSRARAKVMSSRTALLFWVGGLVLTTLAFVGVVFVANSTVYSAGGFVTRYLDALDRRDLATLLETPGVVVPDGAAGDALVRAALAPVDRAEVVATSSAAAGRTGVDVDWTEGDESGTIRFEVEPAPAVAGLFSGWRFAVSPVQSVAVDLLHATDLRVNDVDISPAGAAGPNALSVSLAAFAPSRLVLDHHSRYLTAEATTVVVTTSPAAATVDVQANAEFTETVQTELDTFLSECAEQEVLLPAGCPFGTFVDNRLVGPPAWEIVDFPLVAVQPGVESGVWTVPPTTGNARVTAEVISLFDGSRSALDETVPFNVEYRIEIDAAGALRIIGGA